MTAQTSLRTWVAPLLGALLLANVVVFVLVVRPLAQSTRGAGDRAARAALALDQAERERSAAQALADARARTKSDLEAFYTTVLPVDLSAARQLTYASLPALARQRDVQYVRRRFDVLPATAERPLSQLTMRMELQGGYEDLRQFIHDVERGPAFVVIDEIALSEIDEAQPLALAIALSTFFRPGGHEP